MPTEIIKMTNRLGRGIPIGLTITLIFGKSGPAAAAKAVSRADSQRRFQSSVKRFLYMF